MSGESELDSVGNVQIPRPSRVLVLGGTHGNEMSGLFLARHWSTPEGAVELRRRRVQAVVDVGNPRAARVCRRYTEEDLNRAFGEEDEESRDGVKTYEKMRAEEIKAAHGGRKTDFLIDCHNTTSNVGVMIIITYMDQGESETINEWAVRNRRSLLSLHVARLVMRRCRQSSPPLLCGVFAIESSTTPSNYTESLTTNFGVGIEVGPQPHGVLRADAVAKQRLVVGMILDFLDELNSGVESLAGELEVFSTIRTVPFPSPLSGADNPWHVGAIVHPNLQDRDYQVLEPGQPAFLRADGTEVPFAGPEPVYPVFINEAAYYEKDAAFWETKKKTIRLPALKVDDGDGMGKNEWIK